MAYVTLAEIKTELRITSSEADTKLSGFIATAKERIDDYCMRTFEADEDETRSYGMRDVRGAKLRFRADLAQITSITNGDGQLIPSSEYRPLPRNETPLYGVELKTTSVWSWADADSEIEVVGRWAYSVTRPDIINRAAVRLVCYWYDLSATNLHGAKIVGDGEGTRVIVPKDLPGEVLSMLAAKRRKSTA